MTSASRTGMLNLNEVRLIETRWKVGSLGFADRRAVAATAEAAPIKAELQLHFTSLGLAMYGVLMNLLVWNLDLGRRGLR